MIPATETTETTPQRRTFTTAEFDRAYDEVVIGNHFFEEPAYYRRYRGRYRRTLAYVARLPLPRPARILEVGGGQMILLCRELFGDHGTLADVSETYADAVTRFDLGFTTCDLLHDDLPARGEYDLVVLGEVIEHLPVPPHIVLDKVRRWIRPGGHVLVTTPNLYRLRNVVRLALGMRLFCNFYYPPRGRSLGHPVEYSREQLGWQIERAGLDLVFNELTQLSNRGSSVAANVARALMVPLLARPEWRDNLVACGRRPRSDHDDLDATPAPTEIPEPAARFTALAG